MGNLIAPQNHLIGWIAIVGKGNENEMKQKIDLGLTSFVGDYGLIKEIKASVGFSFGLWKPELPLPLTTWSLSDDADHICFIEGVFYDKYVSHEPLDGEDKRLVKILLKNYKDIGAKAIENLNGAFSGFVFDRKSKKLVTFVDRLGVRILYWSYEKGDVIVSSNLAAYRSLKRTAVDESAAFQFLTVGFPIGERTLLKDINIQRPSSINVFNGSSKESFQYWDVQKRDKNLSLMESVEMISQSMEDFVDRIYNRTKQKLFLGLTGGHDSRVVLSALAYRNIDFELIRWDEGDFNDRVARQLCSIIKKELSILRNISSDELKEINNNVFIYSDGNYLHPHGFTRLSKECYEHSGRYLLVGFGGDLISGGSETIPYSQNLRNVEQLAKYALKSQMELLSFQDAVSVMKNSNASLIHETISEWNQTFFNESCDENLLDIEIRQRINNCTLKRVRFGMNPMNLYTQPLFPYLDNKVLDSYFSLPIKYLHNQKAHCYAGFYRFEEFGRYQACSYPNSLKKEGFFPQVLHLLRYSTSKFRGLSSTFRSGYKCNWGEKHENLYNEISSSLLFNSSFLKELFVMKKINSRDLNKLHTLSRFHDFYVSGNNSHIPQKFLCR